MEMKINFNKLFEISDSDSHTPSTTSLQNSYNFDEPSVLSNTSNHINLHYKFNEALFFDSQATMQNEQQINILGDLSSIGRSFQDSFEKQAPLKPAQKSQKTNKKTPKINKSKNEEQFFTKQTFGIGEKTLKTPGQRLYYEHKINEQRRLREVERLKMQKQEHQKKEVTFKPVINEKSKKILQLADSPLRKLNNFKKSLKLKQTQQEIKSTAQKKHEEDLKNCTFHPTLTKTPKNKFTMNSLNERRNKDQVFEELYKDHKIKQMKRKQAELQQSKRQKKMTQQQLEQFLSRHEEYLQQKLHKEELMRAVSSQYDLSSGRKLFEPKINETSEALISSASVKRFISSPSTKKFVQQEEQLQVSGHDSKKILRTDKSKSGKSKSKNSKKSRSNSKNGKSIGSKKSLFQKVANNEEGSKKQIKEKLLKKDQKKGKNNQDQFQPLPYQVTKVQNKDLQKANKHQTKDKSEKGYERPSSTIFSKMKATESVFEQKNQDESNKSERSDRRSSSIDSVSINRNQSKKSILEDSQSNKGSNHAKQRVNSFGNEQNNELNIEETEGREETYDYYEKYDEKISHRNDSQEQDKEHIDHSQNEHTESRQEEQTVEQVQQHQPINHQWKPQLFVENQERYFQKENVNYNNEERDRQQFDGENQLEKDEQESSYKYEENQLSETEEQHVQSEAKDDFWEKHEAQNQQQPQELKQQQKNISGNQQNSSHSSSHHSKSHFQQQKDQGMKSSFLKSISSNPQNNQKYQNLFDLGQEINRSHHSSPMTQRQSISSDEPRESPFKLQIASNIVNMINEPSDSHSEGKDESEQQDAQDRELSQPYVNGEVQINQVEIEQKSEGITRKLEEQSKKNWQEVFNSSAYGQDEPSVSQFSYSSRQKRTNQEAKQPQKTLQSEESPKKKPINIASLLKGKKKFPQKTQQI